MVKRWIKAAVVCVALSVPWFALEAAPPRPGGLVPEVAGTLQDWNLGVGYVVVDGVRYRTSKDAAVIAAKGGGEDRVPVLKRGLQTGLVTTDGVVTAIVVMPEE